MSSELCRSNTTFLLCGLETEPPKGDAVKRQIHTQIYVCITYQNKSKADMFAEIKQRNTTETLSQTKKFIMCPVSPHAFGICLISDS